MARGIGFSRRRIGVIVIGIVLVIFLGNVILTGGQNLFLADPFAGGLDFRQVELEYSLFALADVSDLRDHIPLTDQQIRDLKCRIKLHTSAELDNGRLIPLDSPFQTFGALTPFDILTPQGGKIEEFRDIELRMTCDSIPKTGGGQHEFEMVPRAGSPLFLSAWGYNQQGQLVQLKGIDLKPAFEFGGFAFRFPSQVDFLVNPDQSQLNEFGRIKFANEPSIQDPLKPCCTGLYTTSERTISKPVRVSANFLEDAIEKSTSLPRKTFTTEIQFRLGGSFDISFPELRDAGVLNDRQIPIDQFVIRNKMDVQITEQEGGGGFNLLPDDKTQITKLQPLNSKGEFVTDGSATTKTLQVFVTLDNYDRNSEGSVRGTLSRHVSGGSTFSQVATTGLGCGFPISVSGVQSNFLCNFNILQNTEPAEHFITIKTSSADRVVGSKTFFIVRSGAPTGGDDGCADGYVRNSLGICVLFGSSGTGGGVFSCPPPQFKNEFGQCILGTGSTGGEEEAEPCPIQGEVRDEFGLCRPTTGTGGVGTKSCVDCQMNVIRTVAEDDMCPTFTCGDGTTVGEDDSIMNCPDNKPADIVAGEQTCNRVAGLLGGLLPILVDCEGEGRQANPERGEICVPAFVIGLFENLPLLIGIVIFLIIFIAIIGAILKKSPVGRAVGAFRGALPRG